MNRIVTSIRQGKSITHAVAVCAVGLYVALAPSFTLDLVEGPGLYDEKRLLQIILLVGVGLTFLVSSRARVDGIRLVRALPIWAQGTLLLVLVAGVLSAVLAPQPRFALLEVSHYLLLFGAALCIATMRLRQPRLTDSVLVGSIVLGAFLYGIHFFIGYGMHLYSSDAFGLWPDAYTGFANLRFFNQYQTWTLPVLVSAVLAVPVRRRVARNVLFGLVALWWMLMVASQVRGTLLATLVSALAMYGIFREKSWRWVRILVAGSACGLVLYGLLFHFIAPPGGGGTVLERELSSSRRLQAWRDGLGMLWKHIWLGAGPMHFAWEGFQNFWAHPHNALVQWGAEWGLPSVVGMIGLSGGGYWAWIQQSQGRITFTKVDDESSRWIRIGISASLLAGATHALVSGVIVMPVSQMLLTVMVGWAWGVYRSHEKPPRKEPSGRAHWLCCATAALATGIVLICAAPEIPELHERRMDYTSESEENTWHPRYWHQGFIGIGNEQMGPQPFSSAE